MVQIITVQIQLEQFLVRKRFTSSFTIDYSEMKNNSHKKFSFSTAIRLCHQDYLFLLLAILIHALSGKFAKETVPRKCYITIAASSL